MKKVSLFFAALFCVSTMSAITFDPKGGTLATAPADNDALWAELKADYEAYNGITLTKNYDLACTGNAVAAVLSSNTTAQAKNISFLTADDSKWSWLGNYYKSIDAEYFIATLGEPYWRYETQGFFQCTKNGDETSCGHHSYIKHDWTTAGTPAAWQPWYVFGVVPTFEGKEFAGWYKDAACTAGNEVTTLVGVEDDATLYAKWEGSVAISGITLSKTSTSIVAGQSDTITAEVAPTNASEVFTVATSDETVAIATIKGSDIIITAFKGGEATISVVYAAGKSDCVVTVTEAIAIELHEGTLAVPADNEALWDEMGPQFDTYYPDANKKYSGHVNYQHIGGVGNMLYSNDAVATSFDILTKEDAPWKWLGDYMIKQVPGLKEGTTTHWRFDLAAFFNAEPAGSNGLGDWTINGHIGIWRPYYALAHTPKKEGYTFDGWYLDEAHTVKAVAADLKAGDTIHAAWKADSTTALENVAAEANVTKVIENGQVIIIRDGVRYNTLGAIVK